jgi:hypothetical protein
VVPKQFEHRASLQSRNRRDDGSTRTPNGPDEQGPKSSVFRTGHPGSRTVSYSVRADEPWMDGLRLGLLDPTAGMLQKLAKALGVPVTKLLK